MGKPFVCINELYKQKESICYRHTFTKLQIKKLGSSITVLEPTMLKKGRTPDEDLWKYYFTSSKRIKDMIEDYGIDSFEVEIVFRDVNYDKCFWEEQRLIIEHKKKQTLS